VKKVGIAASVILACLLMRATLWSSKCSEPVLVEILHPQLPPRPHGPFTVVTLNMAGVSQPDSILEEFNRREFFADADIVFLQEVTHSEEGTAVLKSLVERMRLHALFATSSEPAADGRLEGIAILSRHPLTDALAFDLPRFGLRVRSRCRLALAATITPPSGPPLRVFGVHLDTRLNAPERIAQLAPVLEAAQQFGGPAIIGGDFNTNNIFWVEHILPLPYFHDQNKAVGAFFRQHGFSTPINGSQATFNHFGFRLDWIYLQSLKATAYGVEPIDFSDHRAVWVRLDGRIPIAGDS
jgi:endonuclease/exonuclease/phosphatase family metal-dependent hydrolase